MLSLKAKENNLVICEDLNLATNKTKDLSAMLNKLDLKSALFVDFGDFDNFKQACSNLYRIDVLPTIGLNVYDGLRHEKIVLTRSAVEKIQERLG